MINSTFNFFNAFLKNPFSVGSAVPSSRYLGTLMASAILDPKNDLVIEIGAGLGSITDSILKSGVLKQNFLAVENNPVMFDMLLKRFDNKINAINADASTLDSHVGTNFLQKTDCIISTLPFKSLKQETIDMVLESSIKILKKGGIFVQMTYSPFGVKAFQKLKNVKTFKWGSTFLNIPPAYVFIFQKI